ncbi:MAG: J domain-containing protein [Calditrichaeota bacterium]|nr:MAG: J domain-containing protein [Calditrichota bacterium]
MKDYYEILGIGREATLEEIKQAYRNLVRLYHPDMGDTADVEKFLEVQEAFEVLSDEEKRAAYNRKLEEKSRPVSSFRSSWENILSDLEYILFHEQAVRRSQVTAETTRPEYFTEPDLAVEITLTPEEARTGGNIPLEVPVRRVCPYCKGTGVLFPFTCFNCLGSGSVGATRTVNIRIPVLNKMTATFELDLRPYGVQGQLKVTFRVAYY